MTGTGSPPPREGAAPSSYDDAFDGVSLAQFAGVEAALAEGLALDAVLAQERIAHGRWPAVQRGFRARIAESTALHLAYSQRLRTALDCLARTVDPLDRDPAAWAGLLGAISLSDDPDAVLRGLGVTMNDVDRLGRLWRRRAQAEPDVSRQLTAAAGTAKPPASVQVGPIRLVRFPWSPGPAEEVADAEPDEELRRGDASLSPVLASPQLARASFQLAEHGVPRVVGQSEETELPRVASVDLPFRRASGPTPPSWPHQTEAVADQSGETLLANEQGSSASTLPFEPDGWMGLLSLRRYVDMVLMLRAQPDRAEPVMLSFGITDAALATRVHGLWKLRFAKNPALLARFEQLLREAPSPR